MTPETLATLAREAVDCGDVCDLDDCPAHAARTQDIRP